MLSVLTSCSLAGAAAAKPEVAKPEAAKPAAAKPAADGRRTVKRQAKAPSDSYGFLDSAHCGMESTETP